MVYLYGFFFYFLAIFLGCWLLTGGGWEEALRFTLILMGFIVFVALATLGGILLFT